MSRKTVRVKIPKGQPDRLIQLANDILAKHASEGANSPLDPGKLTRLQEIVSEADRFHANAKRQLALAHKSYQRRDDLLGTGVSQSIDSPDTALNLIGYVRDQLAIHCARREQELGEYGFDISLGAARSPQREVAEGGAAAV